MIEIKRERLVPLILCLLWTPAATAQGVAPGQRVRITVEEVLPDQVEGELVQVGQDTLVIVRDGERLAVPRLSVTRTEVVAGRHGHTLGGSVIGGLAAGAVVGQDMLRNPSQCRGSGNYGQICAMFLAGSLVGGALVGGLIGTAIRHDDWIAVSLALAGFDPHRSTEAVVGRVPLRRSRFSIAVVVPLS